MVPVRWEVDLPDPEMFLHPLKEIKVLAEWNRTECFHAPQDLSSEEKRSAHMTFA